MAITRSKFGQAGSGIAGGKLPVVSDPGTKLALGSKFLTAPGGIIAAPAVVGGIVMDTGSASVSPMYAGGGGGGGDVQTPEKSGAAVAMDPGVYATEISTIDFKWIWIALIAVVVIYFVSKRK